MNDLCGFEPNQYTSAPHQTEGWIEFREAPDQVFARVADHAAIVDWLPLAQEITVTHPHTVQQECRPWLCAFWPTGLNTMRLSLR